MALVTMVKPLRVDTVEKLHSSRQTWRRCLEEEVIVVRHQAVGVADPPESPHGLFECRKEVASIPIAEKDLSPRITPAGDVVDSPIKLDAQWSSHDGRSVVNWNSKIKL